MRARVAPVLSATLISMACDRFLAWTSCSVALCPAARMPASLPTRDAHRPALGGHLYGSRRLLHDGCAKPFEALT